MRETAFRIKKCWFFKGFSCLRQASVFPLTVMICGDSIAQGSRCFLLFSAFQFEAKGVTKLFGGGLLECETGLFSLRLGRAAALTCHWHVIHYRSAASLPLALSRCSLIGSQSTDF